MQPARPPSEQLVLFTKIAGLQPYRFEPERADGDHGEGSDDGDGVERLTVTEGFSTSNCTGTLRLGDQETTAKQTGIFYRSHSAGHKYRSLYIQ